MKKLTILILLIGRLGFGQSNPGLDLAVETERIKALRGTPTIQIGLAMPQSGEVAGIKRSALLEQLETCLSSAQVPYVSAKNGIGLRDDTLMVSFQVIPLKGVVFYSIKLSLLELARPVRQADYETAVHVWEDDDFGPTADAAGAVKALMDLMKKFTTDYLRANPDLQLKIRR